MNTNKQNAMTTTPAPRMRAAQAARPLLALVMVSTLAGCEAIGTIFEAGVWVGVVIVIGIVALVAVIAGIMRR
jgi:hypothetical protein